MEEYYQMTIDDWLASKTEEIRQELGKAAQSFVAIGYKLKEVRDSGNLAEGETISDYAFREFGLSSSTTSRFIAINEKFGNGLELKHEFVGIGSAKLQEMLTLSDADCELITKNHTVKQIREIKAFSNSGEEVTVEHTEDVQKHGALEKCIIDYFKDKPDLLNEICLAKYYDTDDYKKVADMLSPNGSTTHKKGIIFLFMYKFDEGVKYKVFGEAAPREMSYIEFIETIRDIFPYEDDVKPHEAFYGVLKESENGETSEVEPVATSQVEETTEEVEEVTETVKEEPEYKESVSEPQEIEEESQEVEENLQELETESGDCDAEDYGEAEEESEEAEQVQQEEESVEEENIEECDSEDPRKELIADIGYYCDELKAATLLPPSEYVRFRTRSDELMGLLMDGIKDLLLLNIKMHSEFDEDED